MNNLKEGTLLQNGKYKIIHFISSGGFGCTYEGVHTMLDTKVAIKEFFVKDFCNRDEATSHITIGTESKRALVEKLRKKFVEEAKILFKELKHPGIVRVTDIFEENGTAYYVMDYIEGRSLNDIVKTQGKLSESDALRYIRQAGDALAYVHSQNMLHLDIKPGNIMIDSISDRAVLIDFGTSKQYDEVDGENTSTLMGKTPGFAPPEQMGNDVVKFTPATDIYSLGATLYKLLTGKTPPSATQLISGENLATIPSTINFSTRNAISKSMILNKADRPQTIAAFLQLLNKPSEELVAEVDDSDDTIPETTKPKPMPKPEPPKPKPTPAPKPGYLKYILGVLAVVLGVVIGVVLTINDSAPEQVVVEPVVVPEEVILPSNREEQERIAEEQRKRNETTKRSGTINGHDYVDLGLSVKWATCNVGASQPHGYGNYYAWGETTTKSEYTEENSRTYGKNMSDIIGNSSYDAARANWGGSWRLPTQREMVELVNICTWTWTTQSGVNGYKVTGPNGNSIFLPAAGYCDGSSRFYVGESVQYWSSRPYEGDTGYASQLYFNSGGRGVSWRGRNYGLTVRPVSV